jgi:histidine triad (HIT) family protein
MPPGPRGSTDCVFCAIIEHRAPAHVVFEDEQVVAFLDIYPFTRGHLLVVPKHHVDRLTDLPAAEYAPLLGALSTVCQRIERLSRDYNVALNQGALAGQIVFHLHFHVIPRYDSTDPFRVPHRAPLTDAEGRALVEQLAPP